MKTVPTISKYMTVTPHSIGYDQTIERAREMMSEYHIRHLPVLKGGKLVGILTDRDIKLVLGFNSVDAGSMKVDEAYTPDPYITNPESPLDEVAEFMSEKKYGCALIVDNGKLVGIFTEVDAMKALADLLRTRLKH
jgi:acetoin utilization protein AcuB